MERRAAIRGMLAAATALLVASCDPVGPGPIPPPPAGTPLLGHVQRVDGARNAFIVHNGVTAPAREGDPIYAGDRFYTGNATRMRIVLDRPGDESFELDENTDPIIEDAACLVLRLFRTGRIYASVHGLCVQSTPNQTIQYSKVAYEILAPGVMQVTVFEGQVRTIRPPGQVIPPGYRLVLAYGRATTPAPVPVTPEQQRASVGWTMYPPPLVRPGGLVPGREPPGRFPPGRLPPFRPRPTPSPTPTQPVIR